MKGRKVWLILVVWILQLLAHTPLDHCWHHRVNLALEQELPHLDPHNPLVFHFHIAHLETIEKPSPFDTPPPPTKPCPPPKTSQKQGRFFIRDITISKESMQTFGGSGARNEQ
jgi:hypothetical protein